MTDSHRLGLVHAEGLEPPRLAAPDPKSGAATNYATRAETVFKRRFFLNGAAKVRKSALICNKISRIPKLNDGYAVLVYLFVFQRNFHLPACAGFFIAQISSRSE